MQPGRLTLALALLSLPLGAAPGCGNSGDAVRVTGKLVKGGASYAPPAGQLVNVTLVGLGAAARPGTADPGGEPFWAEVDQARGTFSVPGRDGRGIPPGKYRVAVTRKRTREAFEAAYPTPKKGVSREDDLLAGRFGLQTSAIVREIKSASDLTVDLDRPGGE